MSVFTYHVLNFLPQVALWNIISYSFLQRIIANAVCTIGELMFYPIFLVCCC